MRYQEFVNALKKNEIPSRILIYGNEFFLLDKSVRDLRSTVCPILPELNCTILDGAELSLDTLTATCESWPMMDERRLVVVKGSLKGEAERFAEMIQRDLGVTVLVWIVYGDPDKRTKPFQVFKKDGIIYEFNRIDQVELTRWINGLLKKAGKTMGNQASYALISRTGYLEKNSQMNLYHIENEVNKLIAYVGEENEITVEAVEAVTTKNIENDIFKLINACRDGKTEAALKAFGQLMFWGESPMGILAMLTRQIKNMYYAKEIAAKGLGYKEMAKELKLHEFAAKQCLNASGKIPEPKIKHALEKCLKTEMDFKSGKIGEKLAMEVLITDLFR